MKRRALLAAGMLLVLMPSLARAQGRGPFRVGYLSVATSDLDGAWLATFRSQMRALGYIEGKNLRIDERRAHGHAQKLAALADELLQLRPDVLVVYGAWLIGDKLRGKTPVVFTIVPDPVSQGIVRSLARPEGNLTGFSDAHGELVPKRLEFIREVLPSARRVGLLYFPTDMTLMQVKIAENAAPGRGLTLVAATINGPGPEEVERAFASMVKERADAVLVVAEPIVAANRRRIAELGIQHRLMTISTVREFAESGFLMAYGTNFHDLWRRSALYVDKILKGARPADLPVEQPTKFDLVINRRTAKAIGIEVPRAVLARADHVID